MTTKQTLLILFIACLSVSCANRPVSTNELNVAKTIEDDNSVLGTVLVVREVKLKKAKTGVASAIGKTLGSYGGGALGTGVLSAAGSVAGGLVGGAIGSGIDEYQTTQSAIEILVKTNKGKTLLITQLDEEEFKPGDKVRIITLGNKTHVTHREDLKLDDEMKEKIKALKKKPKPSATTKSPANKTKTNDTQSTAISL